MTADELDAIAERVIEDHPVASPWRAAAGGWCIAVGSGPDSETLTAPSMSGAWRAAEQWRPIPRVPHRPHFPQVTPQRRPSGRWSAIGPDGRVEWTAGTKGALVASIAAAVERYAVADAEWCDRWLGVTQGVEGVDWRWAR